MPTWSSPTGLDTPRYLHNPFHVGVHFGAALVHNCYGLSGCWPPRTDLTGIGFQPQEAFTSRLSTERSNGSSWLGPLRLFPDGLWLGRSGRRRGPDRGAEPAALSVGRRSQLGISRGLRRTAMQGCLRAFDDERMTIAMQY
jgi:hypothetical protein